MRLRAIATAMLIGLAISANASAQITAIPQTATATDPLLTALNSHALASQTDRDAMVSALNAAETRHDLDDAVFDAGMALGAKALEAGDYPAAHRGWTAAANHAGADASAETLLRRDRARTGDAVTSLYQGGDHNPSAHNQAYAQLQLIATELFPYAILPADGAQLTTFQAAYAEAIAWREIATMSYTPRSMAALHDINGAVVCPITWHGNNNLDDTLRLAQNGSGLAIFRVVIDDGGATTSVVVAYAAPPMDYTRTIAQISRLHAQRATRAPAGCVMPHIVFVPLTISHGPWN
jgi:hypothetical protein